MQILSFEEYGKEKALELYQLWNWEYGFIFPITKELFMRNTYATPGFLENESYVALVDNKPVGFIIDKIWQHQIELEQYLGIGWISLIFVKSEYRNQGIGTRLLDNALSAFKKRAINKIYLGKDYQNFFPGLPKDLKAFHEWFVKRGFQALYETNDLINLNLNSFKMPLVEYRSKEQYTIKLLEEKDIPSMQKFLEDNFPGRWLVEYCDYLKQGGTGNEFLICINSLHEVIGFCRIGTNDTPINQIGFSLTWRKRFSCLGGLGPLGVAKGYRHQNIAHNLLVKAILELKYRGCDKVIIDWTNLLELYRLFGFELWKTYTYFEKNI